MSEPAPEYETERGKGRPKGKYQKYPEKVFARVTKEQHQHLKDKYGDDVSAAIRALIDADIALTDADKMVIVIKPETKQAMKAPRKPGDIDGDDIPF